MTIPKRLGAMSAIAGLTAVGIMAAPHDANAWWRGGVGVVVPPIVAGPPVYAAPAYVAPPQVYVPPPPRYYPAPRRVWVPPQWNGPYWVRGHWS